MCHSRYASIILTFDIKYNFIDSYNRSISLLISIGKNNISQTNSVYYLQSQLNLYDVVTISISRMVIFKNKHSFSIIFITLS